jgi:hypothetical protein
MLSGNGYAAVDAFYALRRQSNLDSLREHVGFVGDTRQEDIAIVAVNAQLRFTG